VYLYVPEIFLTACISRVYDRPLG